MKKPPTNLKLIYRKLKISDFNQFRKLFYECFNREVSFEFFKWRYFNKDLSFCYGAFFSNKLIANVGMVYNELNNKKREKIFSRHSSMVSNEYRGIGIFSSLLSVVRDQLSNDINCIVMWPNNKNFSNFGIDVEDILNKKYYIYKTNTSKNLKKKNLIVKIENLKRIKNFIKKNDSLFFKNFIKLHKKYLSYKKNEFYIDQFQLNNQKSFFIIKRNKEKSILNSVIFDHFGSIKLKKRHFSYLIHNQNNLVFLSKKKINKDNYKLINYLNIKIGFTKKINLREKKNFLKNKEIYLGDTDIFMSI